MELRQLPDLPSRETKTLPFELRSVRELTVVRADGVELDMLRVEGHATVWDVEYKVWGGPPYGWIEHIDAGAADETLAEDPDVVFLLNHGGMTMARTKSGTLTLEADKTGLFSRADLDLRNPDVVKLGTALERGDIDEMSFAFRVTRQEWYEHADYEGDEYSGRAITGFNINRGDVSAVNFGANPETDLDIMRALKHADQRELVDYRAVIDDRLGTSKTRQEKPDGTSGETERDGTSDLDLAWLGTLK